MAARASIITLKKGGTAVYPATIAEGVYIRGMKLTDYLDYTQTLAYSASSLSTASLNSGDTASSNDTASLAILSADSYKNVDKNSNTVYFITG